MLKPSSAFTIIEVIVAIFILTISLLGFFQVSNYIIAKINTSDYRVTAVNYAAGGAEIVRSLRDYFMMNNLNRGWFDNQTDEIDSFVELIETAENGEYKIVSTLNEPVDGAVGSEAAEIVFNGFTLEPITDPRRHEEWELVWAEGFVNYYRKVKIENAEMDKDFLKKVVVSVYFEDGIYDDTIQVTMYLGNIGMKGREGRGF
jgi:hypothetical protein